jgi:hypothetical protein
MALQAIRGKISGEDHQRSLNATVPDTAIE